MHKTKTPYKNMKKLIIAILVALAIQTPGLAKTELDRTGERPVLKLDGKGYVILGGELGNSSATCARDIEESLEKAAGMNLNTVLVPAYWDLTEPEEGKYDYTLTEKVIETAAEKGLGVVFLWFGTWKNSMSCYVPEWVKRDTRRFPRVKTRSGKALEIVTPFSTEMLEADRTAFTRWLRHVADYDTRGVVRMIQIENEIGMLEEARDHSALAETEYRKGVPEELTRYLEKNRNSLHPELKKRWEENGCKKQGGWKEVFGDDIYTQEYFMAWNYARYVEQLAKAGREITGMPFYVNAALNSRGRKPGEYPSAGPLAHLKDIWHAGAPAIDFLSPDIYDIGFEGWVEQYALPDNVLFIPEVGRDDSNAAQAYYVIGHHKALGISPFSIENGNEGYAVTLAPAYSVISQLTPLLTNPKKKEFLEGVKLSKEKPESVIYDGKTRITLSHFFTLPWDPRATDGSRWRESGAIILRIAPDEYLLAGTGVVAKFEDDTELQDDMERGEDGFAQAGSQGTTQSIARNGERVGLASVEEVRVTPDGRLERIRSLNGDETHQGRHARISVDDNQILHIKIYRYK